MTTLDLREATYRRLFLILTGIKVALPKKEEFEPEKNIAVRLCRRFYPVTSHCDQGRFF